MNFITNGNHINFKFNRVFQLRRVIAKQHVHKIVKYDKTKT